MARSSRPIWDGPSAPISTPQWVPHRLMEIWETAAMRMKSWARVKKAAKVVAYGR